MDSLANFYGYFLGSIFPWACAATAVAVLSMGYVGAPLWLWTLATAVALFGFQAPLWLIGALALVALVMNLKPVRATLVSRPLMGIMKGIMPSISETERVALEAGVVWIEGELFSGRPDFNKILAEPYPKLTPEEQAFVDGPTEKLCALIDDHKLWRERELSKEVWDFMKREKFLGMIIPKEYGGLGFSAYAHSQVIMKLSSRSAPAAITVMVPNSLGPAELLNHYGTDEQKKYYLPRLATGEEIPCFALTEPTAGSDAGSLTAEGILFKGADGKLYLKLSWNKRWITLAAVSTILGLAFRLRDPDNLLNRGEDVGITCALIPTQTPGVVVGRRHDPLGTPFYNCPTQGHDVVVSVDTIVGGLAGAGQGWKMLMECLAAGRGISLPAQGTGGAKFVSRVASNHASIRKQFNLPIGKFEGIEEPLARVAGSAYALDAMRKFTLAALDKGVKPPVITAMAKYQSTEISRQAINDGMDILGGAGISLGPRNLLGHLYIATPIGITVEGANIMTRTLIIFGQGALRAHPYAFKEVDAIAKQDLLAFDRAFWGHVGHVICNKFRSVLLSLSRGRLASAPSQAGPLAIYYKKLSWASANFALMSDIAMASLGGGLKMKEKITGRYADILSWMYIATCVLRRWEAEGRKAEDLPLAHYSLQTAFAKMQHAFEGIYANLEVPGLTWFFRGPLSWWCSLNGFGAEPNDRLSHQVANLVLSDSAERDRLTDGIYIPKDQNEALSRQELAFRTIKRAERAEKKIRAAVHERRIERIKGAGQAKLAFEKSIISREEFDDLNLAEELRLQAIQVDDFSQSEYHDGRDVPSPFQVAATRPHEIVQAPKPA